MALINCPKCGKQISDQGPICPGCMTPMAQLLSPKTSPQPPRTAEGMYTYCQENRLGSGISKSWDLKHLRLIAEAFAPNEQVLAVFIGFHNYISATQHDNIFAYAVTNKRFILAQKKLIGSIFQTISLENVNDVTLNTSFLKGIVTVDTIKETFNVKCADVKSAENIYHAVHAALERVKQKGSGVSGGDLTTQLTELKELLRAGLITQRDYESKKRQLLGL